MLIFLPVVADIARQVVMVGHVAPGMTVERHGSVALGGGGRRVHGCFGVQRVVAVKHVLTQHRGS